MGSAPALCIAWHSGAVWADTPAEGFRWQCVTPIIGCKKWETQAICTALNHGPINSSTREGG